MRSKSSKSYIAAFALRFGPPEMAARAEPRPFGLAAGGFRVPPSFFDPLAGEIVEGFAGRGG